MNVFVKKFENHNNCFENDFSRFFSDSASGSMF